MARKESSCFWFSFCLLASVIVNIYFLSNLYYDEGLSWSEEAAAEAEFVASINCSNHGRAYLDGVVFDDGNPICECNTCYGGSDCSIFLTGCAADADRSLLYCEARGRSTE